MTAVTAIAVQDQARDPGFLEAPLGQLSTAQGVLTAPVTEPYGTIRLYLTSGIDAPLDAPLHRAIEAVKECQDCAAEAGCMAKEVSRHDMA